MNVNGFRRWLKSQIALLDDDTDSAVDRGGRDRFCHPGVGDGGRRFVKANTRLND